MPSTKEYHREYYKRNREKLLKKSRNNYHTTKDEISVRRKTIRDNRYPGKNNKAVKEYYESNPRHYILNNARLRASDKSLDFNLDIEDIIIPEHCPILGIPIKRSPGKCAHANSPTLDRIDNDKGYIKGNVHVISWRANRIKSDATVVELLKIAYYIRDLNGDV